MNGEMSKLAEDAICFTSEVIRNEMCYAISQYTLPSVVYKPRVFIDGKQWCALYGDNIQDGVVGFGKSPAEAMWDFNKNWHKNIGDN